MRSYCQPSNAVVEYPRFTDSTRIRVDRNLETLYLSAPQIEAAIDIDDMGATLEVLDRRPFGPDVPVEELLSCICPDSSAEALKSLVRCGLVVEDLSRTGNTVSGTYLAFRLTLYFQQVAAQCWIGNELFRLLKISGHERVAIGFLLESYMHMRAARWKAAPALRLEWSPEKRDIVESFFERERLLFENLHQGFASIGLREEALDRLIPLAETQLLELFLASCSYESRSSFATSLILTEMPEAAVDDNVPDVIDIISECQSVPSELTSAFKAHDSLVRGREQGTLPERLLCGDVVTTRDAQYLASLIRTGVTSFNAMFTAIAKEYQAEANEWPCSREQAFL